MYHRPLILRSSHAVSFQKKQLFGSDAKMRALRIPASLRTLPRPTTQKKQAGTTKRKRSLVPPAPHRVNDGGLRAIASQAAHMHRASQFIERFSRAATFYCEQVLGRSDRDVVEDYINTSLENARRMATEKNVPYSRDQAHQDAEMVFRRIEEEILHMAANGRRMKQEALHGRRYVLATAGHRSGRRCVLTVEDDGIQKTIKVAALETAQHFNRRIRTHRLNQRRGSYTNRPPRLRY